MIKVLFVIAFALPLFAAAQISTASVNTSSSFTPASSFTASCNFTAGKAAIFFIGSQSTTGTPPIPTMTATGYTWNRLATVSYTNNASRYIRLTAFICYPNTTATAVSNTVDFGGVTQSWTGWVQYRVATGDNVRAFQSAVDSANAADPAITLGTLQGNNNAVIASFLNDKNPFAGTAEAGWTETTDAGGGTAGTNAVGRYAVKQDNHSDNTVTVTSASAKWVGIAIELRAVRKSVFTM